MVLNCNAANEEALEEQFLQQSLNELKRKREAQEAGPSRLQVLWRAVAEEEARCGSGQASGGSAVGRNTAGHYTEETQAANTFLAAIDRALAERRPQVSQEVMSTDVKDDFAMEWRKLLEVNSKY